MAIFNLSVLSNLRERLEITRFVSVSKLILDFRDCLQTSSIVKFEPMTSDIVDDYSRYKVTPDHR